ncbi:PQQ-binding-like beta-propeller repeat protein [Nocardiopsis sp. HNM0947]|uniref:PQQ-binding-like beta-propeller repeat protein n=1 Tax=Nocardiopsis coralli TaxID=2772213 RepID=A0ABR9PD27_9ACTN|nr:PQQ-binding-like beta-propeller repeat protein [Nocardiopsis coralli]MBE3001733.1 PQQ-binding-like beta-propeller repeat protein [Nocardiopsis coralli]
MGALVLSVLAMVQSGRIVPFPEVSQSPEWTAEGLPGEDVGGWWSDDRIVQISEGGLTAVATDDGEELWTLEPDTRVCGMAEEPSDGVGVVLLDGEHVDPDPRRTEEDPERSCDDVLAVDLDEGSELWRSGPLLEDGDPEERYLEELDVSVHESGVVVRVDGELQGFDLSGGSRSWSHEGFTVDGTPCPATDLLGKDGTHTMVAADCGAGDQISVHTVDAGDGEETSSFAFDRGPVEIDRDLASTTLLNADPVMVHLDLGHRRGPERDHDPDLTDDGFDDPHWEQVLVFDESGGLTWSRADTWGNVGDHIHDGPPLLFGEDRVHMRAGTACGGSVHTHDLSDGRELWETSWDGDDHAAVAVQDGQLLVIRGGGPSDDKCRFLTGPREWQFYVLDARTGEAEPLTRQMKDIERPEADQVWWQDGRVYFIEPTNWEEDPSTVVAL